MTRAPRAAAVWPSLAALCLAVMWPLSAAAGHAVVIPAVAGVLCAAAVIVRRPEWGIAALLALAPLTNLVVGAVKPMHLLLPALAGGTLVFIALDRREAVRISHGSTVALMIVLFCAVGLVSALFAIDPSRSVSRLFALLTAAAVFFAVTQVADSTQRLETVIAGVLLGLLVAALHGLGQQISGSFGPSGGALINGEVVSRVQGAFGHPNSYADFLAVVMPLAAAVAVTRALRARLRLLAATAFLLAVPPLVLSFTRGAIVALVIGSLAWLIVVRPRSAVVVAVVLAVVFAGFAPATLRERLRDPGTGDDVGLRADLWQSAIDIYAESPVIGVGMGNFGTAYARLPATIATGSQRRLLHQRDLVVPPHANNLALTVLAEEGLLGLLALVGLVAAGISVAYRLTRVRDPVGRAVGIGLGAGLLVMALHSLLEITLFGEVGLTLFAILGLGCAYLSLARDGEPATA